MDAAESISRTLAVQNAIQTLMTLNFSAYLYPTSAVVSGGETYDFIIVGGGAAGCVVARRLAEDRKTQVLLIEAGGDPPLEANIAKYTPFLQHMTLDWNYESQGDGCLSGCIRRKLCYVPLGKMLGGSSSLGNFIYGVGNRKNYASWAIAANSSLWNAKNVLPYFIKSQKVQDTNIKQSPDKSLFGYRGPIVLTREHKAIANEVLAGFQEAGNPVVGNININRSIGYTSGLYMLANNIRQNVALKYLSPIKDYENLKVLKHTLVTEIIFDKKKNAVAVRIVCEDNKMLVVNARKEIILSAGAINTPKLLMLSGVGPKKHLKKKGIEVISDLPVGQNLQDHSRAAIVFNLKNTPSVTRPDDPRRFVAACIDGYAALNGSKEYPDYKTISCMSYAEFMMPYCTQVSQFTNYVCDKFFAPCGKNTDQTLNLYMFSLLNNINLISRGEVLLRSCKYYDPPVIDFPYCSAEADIENEAKYIKRFMEVLKTKTFKNLNAVWVDPQLEQCMDYPTGSLEYWKCYASCLKVSMYDFCGTCAMGSVVNSRLYVKGTKRLRVVDASVMPTIPSSEILGATIMIGEKGADMIKEDHDLGR